MTFNSIIIGGGPGGLASAIRLARLGERVLLIEQRSLPQEKCCGEFLHPSAVREIQIILGREPAGTILNRVRISSGKIVRDFPISAKAVSLERHLLSTMLFESALKEGVGVVTGHGAKVTSLTSAGVKVVAGQDRYEAEKLIVAEGASSPTLRRLGSTRAVSSVVYGFSTRCPAEFSSGVALAALRGGYAGLCDLGGGFLNVAGLLSAGAYRRLAPNLPEFGSRLLKEIPAWEGLIPLSLRGTLFQVPVCADDIPYRKTVPGPVFVVGDAAGIRETAFGDGIARALRHGRFLEESLKNNSSDLMRAAQYHAHRIKSDSHRSSRVALTLTGILLRTPMAAAGLLRLATPWIGLLAKKATEPAQEPANVFNANPAAALPKTT